MLHETGTFPKTHDLICLIDLIRKSLLAFPDFSLESTVLNEYAVDMRYEPEVITNVDVDEAQATIDYAENILSRARMFLAELPPPEIAGA